MPHRFPHPTLLGVVVALVLLMVGGCRTPQASELPRDEPWMVVVKSARLPQDGPVYKRFAHHAWIDVKQGDEARWMRLESGGTMAGALRWELSEAEARLNRRFGGSAVRVLGTITGETARDLAPKLVARVAELGEVYATDYRVWPGPNSNTLVMTLAREFPELRFVFDGSAVGKDYGGWLDASLTASKTGIRVDSVPVGFAVGLREGVEVHLLQLTLGIGFDPLCLKLPFLPTFPTDATDVDPVALPLPTDPATRLVRLPAGTPREERIELGRLPAAGRLAIAPSEPWSWLEIEWRVGPLVPRTEGQATAGPAGERVFQGVSVEQTLHDQEGRSADDQLGCQLSATHPAITTAPVLAGWRLSIEWRELESEGPAGSGGDVVHATLVLRPAEPSAGVAEY